jgi:2-polyprenyl-6-hydroxyphenyl methylase/3-demethylubiquinone-9 3-methyltransferase
MSSSSASEVAKFSAMDASWWDPKQNPLIGMNVVRVSYIQSMLQQQQLDMKNQSVLDIGCGGGLLSETFARLGAAQVTGIDPSERLIAAARAHAQLDGKTRGIQYHCQTAEEVEQQYQIVCLLEVLEHVPNVDSLLQTASRLLEPNGLLFVSTLNRTVKSHLLTILGAEYLMRYLPVGTHDWNKYLTPAEVAESCQKAGLEQVDVTGMVLTKPPLFGDWDWRLDPNDTNVNWIGTYKKI